MDNLESIRQRMRSACERVGRAPETVTLLAVSKTHPPESIRAAAESGQWLFGESKIQEAKAKIPLCPDRCRWHFIGHLQSNKARDAVQLFQMIESVDSFALAEEISKRCEQSGKTMPILLEVNVAGESSKFGYAPNALLAELENLNALPRISIHGLMVVPPFVTDAEKARPYFRRLRELKGECEKILGAPLPHLSMGMSGDFETAIEEGSTLVRIGTALFGARTKLAVRQATDENSDH